MLEDDPPQDDAVHDFDDFEPFPPFDGPSDNEWTPWWVVGHPY